jgi:hypothetical protein
MKIFTPPLESTATSSAASSKNTGKAKGPHARKHAALPEKQPVSEQEIREKLASHVETSNTAKSKVLQQNSKQLGSGFMNESKPAPVAVGAPGEPVMPIVEAENGEKAEPVEVKDSVKESHLLMSDVKLNDPKDPNTQEKLKSVLSMGAFNFNPREREALDKILNSDH